MIETLDTPPHVAGFRVVGELTADDYDTITSVFDSRLARFDRIGTLSDLTEFDGVTVGAVGEDVTYGLSKLGDLERFERNAVIGEGEWPAKLADLAGKLLSKLEIRTFDPDDADDARDWAAGVSPQPRA